MAANSFQTKIVFVQYCWDSLKFSKLSSFLTKSDKTHSPETGWRCWRCCGWQKIENHSSSHCDWLSVMSTSQDESGLGINQKLRRFSKIKSLSKGKQDKKS